MSQLSHEDLTPDMLMAALASPGAPSLPVVTPATEHDVNTGPVDNGQGDDDDGGETGDGVAIETPAEVVEDGNQAPPPELEPDEFARTPLDEEVEAFTAGDKRIRLTGLDTDGVRAVLVAKRNPDSQKTLLEALVHVRGRDNILKDLGYDPTAATAPGAAPAEPAAPVDPITALENEIDSLADKERGLRNDFEVEEADKIAADLKAKSQELRKLYKAKPAEPAAPQISQEDFSRLFDADRDATVAQFPDIASPDSPMMKEMSAEYARMVAAGDPQANAWNVNSVVAGRVAAKLNLQPRRASSPGAGTQQPAVPRTAPRPVHGSRSAAPPPRVDEAAMTRKLTPHMLGVLLNGGE